MHSVLCDDKRQCRGWNAGLQGPEKGWAYEEHGVAGGLECRTVQFLQPWSVPCHPWLARMQAYVAYTTATSRFWTEGASCCPRRLTAETHTYTHTLTVLDTHVNTQVSSQLYPEVQWLSRLHNRGLTNGLVCNKTGIVIYSRNNTEIQGRWKTL